MASLLLAIIYLAFISLGLPDSLLGSAWPSMYKALEASVSWAGVISMIISGSTIVSSLFSAFSPLFTGLIIAYLISPLVSFIDIKLTRRFCFAPENDPIKRERIYKRCYLISTLITVVLIFSAAAAIICAFAGLIAGSLDIGSFSEMISVVYGYFSAVKSTVSN